MIDIPEGYEKKADTIIVLKLNKKLRRRDIQNIHFTGKG